MPTFTPDYARMAMTKTEFDNRRKLFQDHYTLINCGTSIGGQELSIPMSDLLTAIQAYQTSNNLQENEIGIRLVHCFETDNNSLYLRMQLCKLTDTATNSGGYEVFTVIGSETWYKIKGNALSTTTVTTMEDAAYLSNMYYTATPPCSSGTPQQLSKDTAGTVYVRNLTFPWSYELLKLYTDNGGSSTNAADYTIVFAATCRTVDTTGSNVRYPHDITIYLKCKNEADCMNDENYTGLPMKKKPVDMGTTTPPYHDIYLLPIV